MGKIERLTNSTTGGPVFVDVQDGKIVRIYPMDLDETDGRSWTIEARGRTFTPPRRTTLMPYTAGHKSMIYSPKRVLTPLKRVDFDPDGERNCEKRGESGYEPISWDEALDIISERDQSHQAHVWPRRHAHHLRLPPSLGQCRVPPQRIPALLRRRGDRAGRPQP